MAKLIAVCGMDCAACAAYKATQADDDVQRAKTAAEWTKMFGHEFTPVEINCDGCVAAGRHVAYCGMCEIRACGARHRVANCGLCPEYPCGRITAFFANVPPGARANLEAARAGGK